MVLLLSLKFFICCSFFFIAKNAFYLFYKSLILFSEPGLKLQLNNGIFSYAKEKYKRGNDEQIPTTSSYSCLPEISDGFIGPISFCVFEVCLK